MAEGVVVVFGATGSQGGAVARHLLRRGVPVRAVTRQPEKPQARALAAQGAQVVGADLDDEASVAAALAGADAVFGVLNFWEHGYEKEVAQGRRLVDAAAREGVRHFVYSSVASADKGTGIVHFDSKWEIEKHLARSGLPFTVVRPVFYMENWYFPMFREGILKGELVQPLAPSVRLQMISADDIGGFVATVIADRRPWLGKAVDIAGDSLTMPEVAEHFAWATGRPVRYAPITLEAFEERLGPEWATMYRWFNDVGYTADIEATRRVYPPLRSFRQFLAEHRPNWT